MSGISNELEELVSNWYHPNQDAHLYLDGDEDTLIINFFNSSSTIDMMQPLLLGEKVL